MAGSFTISNWRLRNVETERAQGRHVPVDNHRRVRRARRREAVMIRTFLARGDRAADAVISDGLESITCSNPPPSVQIATLGMKTYCSRCKQEGHVAPRGPRWPVTGPDGKGWALSGDINICGCNPPPVFYPSSERHMTMSLAAEEAAALMVKRAQASSSTTGSAVVNYDEQVRSVSARRPLVGYPYCIKTTSGDVYGGGVDSRGLLPRRAAWLQCWRC